MSLALPCVSACGGSQPTSMSSPSPRALEVASSQDVGAVGTPPSVKARDGGATALIGGQVLWTFGDTVFNPASVDGANLRSSTAAWADQAAALAVREPVDARGAPLAFLPFAAEEQAYNQTSGKADLRIALWPGSVVSDGVGGALAFYTKLIVNPGFLNYDLLGTGVATVKPGGTTAERDPALLFQAPAPLFDKAVVFGGTLYVYGAISDGTHDQPFGVARVPLSRARDRSAYLFWNGSDWVADPVQTRRVLTGIPGDLSVSFNAYLGQYLAVHSGALSNTVFMRVAPKPEGPWGPPVAAFSGMAPPAGSVDYAGKEHAELASDGGRTVAVTYFHPEGLLTGHLRMVAVTFR